MKKILIYALICAFCSADVVSDEQKFGSALHHSTENGLSNEHKQEMFSNNKFPGQPSDVVKVHTSLYSDGALKSEVPYNRENRIHGVRKEYYQSGDLREEISYKDGKKNGQFSTYYNNGMIHEIGEFIDNKLNGLYTEFYSNGMIKFDCTFKNEERDGLCSWYYENGEMMTEEYYENGTRIR